MSHTLTDTPSRISAEGAALETAAADAVQPAISLRGVSKRYGDHGALLPHDLDVREGEFFCLLGPSGCGKTTTLNLIGGFVAPSTGEIYIRGERVDGLPPNRRNANTVFQSYALFPHMTVAENVGFGLKMAGVSARDARPRIEQALAQVGLETYGDRSPAILSGGQQQRVAVARALVNNPAVLLLDEPLGALDLKLRKRLQVELTQIHRQARTTFVYVTHDQEEAMAMADRIAVMSEGRIRQIGTPEEIYLRPTSRFVADFIGESNFCAARAIPPALGGHDGPGTVMVRPEAIRIASPDDAPAHAIEGRVVQSGFLGSATRVTVDCAVCDDPLTVAVHHQGRGGNDFTPELPVAVWWDSGDAVALAPESDDVDNEETVG